MTAGFQYKKKKAKVVVMTDLVKYEEAITDYADVKNRDTFEISDYDGAEKYLQL